MTLCIIIIILNLSLKQYINKLTNTKKITTRLENWEIKFGSLLKVSP